jgi:beta-xylosidase
MFATFLRKERAGGEKGRRGTAVLRSAGIMGPFEPWSEGPVTPSDWECLDGTLYIDKAGTPWMVFCHEWQQVEDGQICIMRLTDDLREAASEPALLFRASSALWSSPLKNRGQGKYVTDGPFVYTAKDGSLILLWSSFGEDGSYRIGAAYSDTIEGPWTQETEPLYKADGGHGMVFKAFDGKLYLSIHTPNKTPNERPIFVELYEEDGKLQTTGRVIR